MDNFKNEFVKVVFFNGIIFWVSKVISTKCFAKKKFLEKFTFKGVTGHMDEGIMGDILCKQDL